MPLLQRIFEHFQNLVLLSDITIRLIWISIIMMCCIYVAGMIFKKVKYESLIVKVGILVRILMIIGFTIEFSYQRSANKGINLLYGKEGAMEQFSNYLFYGYMVVIGIYDILTIGINKFRGFFHTFDIAIMNIPVLYLITGSIIYITDSDTWYIIILVLALFALNFLFFKLYWEQNVKWYMILFMISAAELIYLLKSSMKVEVINLLPAFYMLLGLYELCRKIFFKFRKNQSVKSLNIISRISIIFPLLIIYMGLIGMDVTPLRPSRIYTVSTIYNKNIGVASLKTAETAARNAVEDKYGTLKLAQSNNSNFNDYYCFSIDNYFVQIDGITGKLNSIQYQTDMISDKDKISEEKKNVANKIATTSDIEQKTIRWLKSVGYTFDSSVMIMETEKEKDGGYMVLIYPKYSNGIIEKAETGPARSTVVEISWLKSGRIEKAFLNNKFFSLKDYSQIKIDNKRLEESIVQFYRKLNETVPPYTFGSKWYLFEQDTFNIPISCINGDKIEIDASTGEVVRFLRQSYTSGNANETEVTAAQRQKYNSKAQAFAQSLSSKCDKLNYKLMNESYNNEYRYCYMDNKGVMSNSITITLDSEGELRSFEQGYSLSNSIQTYTDNSFKVSSYTAIKAVSNLYRSLQIYSKRVNLVMETNDYGALGFKWRVVIIPFNTEEHQVYFVDVNSGQITKITN